MITQSAQSYPVDVSVVTVGMNHLPYLKTLLASLFQTQASPLSFEMIYVDNCSHDGSVDFLQQHYPAVRIIRNSTVKGFGENNNIGAQYARGKYIAIINPDIEMINNSLHKLYSFAEQLPYQAILVPRLLNPDGSHQPSARQFMTLRIFLTRFFGRGNDRMAGKNYSELPLQADGCRKKTIYQLGNRCIAVYATEPLQAVERIRHPLLSVCRGYGYVSAFVEDGPSHYLLSTGRDDSQSPERQHQAE